MAIESSDPLAKPFDLVVVGTGLAESIVAAASSHAGLRVAHVDANPYYGELSASFSLWELRSFLFRHGAVPATSEPCDSETHSKEYETRTLKAVAEAEADEAQDWRVLCPIEWVAPCGELRSPRSSISRGFVVSLTPICLMSRGSMIDFLIRGGMASYCVFLTLQGIAIADKSAFEPRVKDSETHDTSDPIAPEFSGLPSGWCQRIPGGKADIISDSSISLRDKRALGRLFSSLLDVAHSAGGGAAATQNEQMLAAGRSLYRPQSKSAASETSPSTLPAASTDRTAIDWLTSPHPTGAGLSMSIACTLLLGIAASSHSKDLQAAVSSSALSSTASSTSASASSTSASASVAAGTRTETSPMTASIAAQRLSAFSFSIGRHAAGVAHVVTEFGGAELPQALCRAAAVGGTTYVLREPHLSWCRTEPPAAPKPATETDVDSATKSLLPPALIQLKTSHGDLACRCLCVSPAHADPPNWMRHDPGTPPSMPAIQDRVIIMAHGVNLLQAPASTDQHTMPSLPPLPVPLANTTSISGNCTRVLVVIPPGSVILSDGSSFDCAVRVLLGSGSDRTAPQGGRHYQLHAVAVGEQSVTCKSDAESYAQYLLEGVKASLTWASRGYDTMYSAGWTEVKPFMSDRAIDSASGVDTREAAMMVIGRPQDGVDASMYLQMDTEAECASARATWTKIQQRFEMINLSAMFAKPGIDDSTAAAETEAVEDQAETPDAEEDTSAGGNDDDSANDDDDFDAADLASLLD